MVLAENMNQNNSLEMALPNLLRKYSPKVKIKRTQNKPQSSNDEFIRQLDGYPSENDF